MLESSFSAGLDRVSFSPLKVPISRQSCRKRESFHRAEGAELRPHIKELYLAVLVRFIPNLGDLELRRTGANLVINAFRNGDNRLRDRILGSLYSGTLAGLINSKYRTKDDKREGQYAHGDIGDLTALHLE